MSDWWSQKLRQDEPQQYGLRLPPVTPQQAPQQQQPYQQPMTVPTQQATYQPPVGTVVPLYEGERQDVLDPRRDPNSEIDMGSAIRLWRGGEAHRKEGSKHCPECGSRNVFSRVGAGTTVSGAAPAPRCFECGWNGHYTQGLQSSWG
jgi:hypothetical protein